VDIFYRWRDVVLDMKEGRIGTPGFDGAALEQLKKRLPRKVWTFAASKGKKDR
jgi:hypothetical protein